MEWIQSPGSAPDPGNFPARCLTTMNNSPGWLPRCQELRFITLLHELAAFDMYLQGDYLSVYYLQ
jgi:hypothetical protein